MPDRTRAEVRVTGVVQGVGFRPFVYRRAVDASLDGYVRNTGDGVDAVFEGPQPTIETVLDAIESDNPPLAWVDTLDRTWTEPTGLDGFEIRESSSSGATGVPVPPDTGICEQCLDDIRDPASHYHDYWATACVDCGPRFTVVRDVPYDRPRTAMDEYPLCEECRARYETPTDRRYHAQTVACAECGPTLRFEMDGETRSEGRTAIRQASDQLADGDILAIRGIGGTHIVCDATRPAVVERLRERIGRPNKPFAVMAPSLDSVESFADLGDGDRDALTDVRRPIVLADRGDTDWLNAVAPGVHTVGVMLPYAGLHHLLFDGVDGSLVMTSANRPGEPMVTTVGGIRERLDSVVDGALVHDRDIVARCDDSVVRVVDGDRRFVRRSRGWTPASLPNPAADNGNQPVLALGPERDVTAAIADGDGVVLSQHIGDVDDPSTLKFHRQAISHLTDLTGIGPAVVACDQHPDFSTSAEAERYAEEGLDGPVTVQHHHAHAAGLCAEHGVERAIVVAADGTGYGPDGTVWGGEVLDATLADFERVGGLDTFGLPGGETAVWYPARTLATLLDDADVVDERLVATGAVDSKSDAELVREQARAGVNTPATTSAGRFLDAVAALVGACDRRDYEGEPAQRLETLAASGTPRELSVPMTDREGTTVVAVDELLQSLAELDAPPADVAATAQDALARGLGQLSVDAARERGVDIVGFTGGVAYNEAISEQLRHVVEERGLDYLVPERIPPGDGGIAYGQAVVATARQ
ncbi:carbamoyltransferase HypF [Salinibaculum rarum]|uniref:carbamoyltransferase HypF n=1 Tax=Salinibaculum rarum TaxID=3058903 RepID=UPI00265ECA11|nr:carbamoyltransferase HypF [Salinibaculum sp. KK48]